MRVTACTLYKFLVVSMYVVDSNVVARLGHQGQLGGVDERDIEKVHVCTVIEIDLQNNNFRGDKCRGRRGKKSTNGLN